eukprot:TRINITY_DN4471_c0_g1_i2.p1 TRINITY_DN4471_c0_g1~~TRINITY_DN4471_c0_g1_i2.p1  ORF type:complete len:235 (-),score=56.41 TRINITY_DN4471_c0_g1_i2:259-963(-)
MEEYIPFGERPEYQDVVPVTQDDGEYPVCPIAYSEDYRDTMDYFRAFMRSQEYSERALALTEEVVDLNPGNYTAWYYRRLILQALGGWKEEHALIKEFVEDNLKNYQVWYHLQCVVEALQDPSGELEFIASVFEKSNDAKNYHAWTYRQWLLVKFDLWENELDFIDKLLTEDVRNNSAWNQRWFVIENTTDFGIDTIRSEFNYTIQKILKAPNNLSPWNYLRGFCSLLIPISDC